MKLYQKFVLFIFIIVFPLGSYLYLRSGYYVRKDALDELAKEIPFDESQQAILDNIQGADWNELSQDIFIMHRVVDPQLKDMTKFAEYLNARNDFQILALYDDSLASHAQDTSFQNIIKRVPMSVDSIGIVMNGSDNILCKSKMQRNTYANTMEELGRLYKHTVILLPLKPKEEVEILRKKEM